MSFSLINSSARKWIYLDGALCLVCLGIDAVAREVFRPQFERSPALAIPTNWPTTTIFNRVSDWVNAGGGQVPDNLVKAMEIYPEHVAICLIVINRENVPASERERIARISGVISARAAIEELQQFVPADESIAKLMTSFNLLDSGDRAAIARSVITAELRRIKDYPTRPLVQQAAPDLAQDKP